MPSSLVLRATGTPSAGGGLTDGMRAALGRLYGDGATADELFDLAGPDGGTMMMYALHVIAGSGALGARLLGDDGPLLTVLRAPAAITLRGAGDPQRLLSRFAYVRRETAQIVVETALSPVRIVVDDPRVIGMIASAAVDLRDDEATDVWDMLARCGVLAGSDDSPSLAMWEFHEMLFHSRSRGGGIYGPRGATFHFRGKVDPLPEAKPPMSDEWLDLAVPDDHLIEPLDQSLASRRSVRTFAEAPITCRELGKFLDRTAREIDGKRPYPSAGKSYELEIYAAVAACDGLGPGLYQYAPREHRLYRCDADPKLTARIVAHAVATAGSGPLQVVIVIAARVNRVFWKYEAFGYALILQDIGVVYQTMYLAANAMGLGGCALGDIDAPAFEAATGLDFREEPAIGGFILGRAAP